jgi:hypothetical protein
MEVFRVFRNLPISAEKKKGGKLNGIGGYGVVYSNPTLPYLEKYDFNSIHNKNNHVKDNELVSKVFKQEDFFLEELNNYKKILKKYNLPEIYFNLPLYYGIIDLKKVLFQKNIYSKKWSNNIDTYLKSPYQITFKKGINISYNNLKDFLSKYINLLECIQYMNNQRLLFDDLKMDNVIEVDNIIKISDFNSIVKFDTLTKDKIYKMQLGVSVYFSYLPILNKLVEYFLDLKKENQETHKLHKLNKIISEIKNEEEQFVKYIRYKKMLFKKIEYFLSVQKINYESIIIPTICHYDICTNKFTNILENININISEIFSNLLFSVNLTENKYYYKLYLDILSKYLLKKYDNLYKNCIDNLLKRINIYCVGHLLIEFISAKIDISINLNNNQMNKYFEKMFNIIGLCCLNIFKINDKIYITEPNINYILMQKFEDYE